MGILVTLQSAGVNVRMTEQIVKATFLDLISGNEDLIEHYQTLINTLPTYEQKQVLYSLIGFLSKEKLMFELSRAGKRAPLEARAVQGVAAVIATLVEGNETLLASLVDWLIGVSAIAPAQSHLAHRAVIAVVGNKNGRSRVECYIFKLIRRLQRRFQRHCGTAFSYLGTSFI